MTIKFKKRIGLLPNMAYSCCNANYRKGVTGHAIADSVDVALQNHQISIDSMVKSNYSHRTYGRAAENAQYYQNHQNQDYQH